MKNLLAGLEDLGFNNLDELDAFRIDENSPEETVSITSNAINPSDYVYAKSYTCPVCEKTFKDKAVKMSKLRFQEVDADLMPKYSPISPFYYNVIICTSCGYSAMSEDFFRITESQGELIRNQITPRYKSKTYPFPLTEDMVIERYKLALLNSVVKRGKINERAYICLVLSWLYKIKEDEDNRIMFVKNAHEGFIGAFGKETFPFYGMNEVVLSYLIAELSRDLGDTEEAMKWVSRVMSSRMATQKVKDMTLELKSRIMKSRTG